MSDGDIYVMQQNFRSRYLIKITINRANCRFKKSRSLRDRSLNSDDKNKMKFPASPTVCNVNIYKYGKVI